MWHHVYCVGVVVVPVAGGCGAGAGGGGWQVEGGGRSSLPPELEDCIHVILWTA